MDDSTLSPELLLSAYCQGYFPMAEHRTGEIGWFKPKMRAILRFEDIRISRSLAKVVRSAQYTITVNQAFSEVINHCAVLRDETWISPEIESAYTELFRSGLAHSIEAWHDQKLVGGLYGVSINGAFFGESMFHLRSDASKVSLVYLVRHLQARQFQLLDCQYINPHMESLGATEITSDQYDSLLRIALETQTTFNDTTPFLSFAAQQLE
ncbi:MAG: leucyl/phenylalanyl-tRNA--protein transferase [Candidatus Kapaibacterium sp.]